MYVGTSASMVWTPWWLKVKAMAALAAGGRLGGAAIDFPNELPPPPPLAFQDRAHCVCLRICGLYGPQSDSPAAASHSALPLP